MMSDSPSAELRVAQVRLVSGRIARVASAISQAHTFGAPEGAFDRPWRLDYHREATRVYAESLPPAYQAEIARLFAHAADSMDILVIPGKLAADWSIVAQYLRSAVTGIGEWIAGTGLSTSLDAADVPDVGGGEEPPMVIRFDALASLTSERGVKRLERASLAVHDHLDAAVPEGLTQLEHRILKMVSEGTHIADLANELGYSQRSVYRHQAKLWHKLGVPGRAEALQLAASEGLID